MSTRATVLVIDDEPAMRRMLSRQLAQLRAPSAQKPSPQSPRLQRPAGQ